MERFVGSNSKVDKKTRLGKRPQAALPAPHIWPKKIVRTPRPIVAIFLDSVAIVRTVR